jgi:hypothetical protein
MSNKSSIESVYKVYDDTEGVSINVESDADALGFVRIKTTDNPKAVEWWGKIDFTMSPEIAENLGKALLKKVKDIRDEEKTNG